MAQPSFYPARVSTTGWMSHGYDRVQFGLITARIERHQVLLTINHNYNKICDIYIYIYIYIFLIKTQEIPYTASSLLFFFAKLLHAKPKHTGSEAASREKRGRLNYNNNVVVCNRAG